MDQQVQDMNRVLLSLKIGATCSNFSRTRNIDVYDLILGPGGKVREIERYSQEIALALKAKALPFVKLITEQGIVRLQVVSGESCMIDFAKNVRDVKLPKGTLPFYLGETIDDKALWIDFHQNPHMLIAGASGSGKSTLLHIIIGNAMLFNDVNLFLIDTKNIEFVQYGEINSARINVDTTYEDSVATLSNIFTQMNETYAMMRQNNLPSNYFATPECRHPYTLIVIDEFADLIMQDKEDVLHDLVCKIAQKGRAAGIHFVVATQRPSVDILRGTIKANFPARIACHVASRVDSNVILDASGAQSLLGNGDAFIRTSNIDMQRFQVAYTTAESNIRDFV